MLTKNKKIIIIVAAFLLVVALVLFYFLWWQKKPAPLIEEKTINKLSEERVSGVKVLSDKIRFLNLDSSTLKELDLKTKQSSEISKIPLFLVQNMIWSPDGNKVILKVNNNTALLSQQGYLLDKNAPDNTLTTWSFDLQTQELIELPREIGGIDWFDNQKIIYYYSKALSNPETAAGTTNSSLNEANYRGENYKKIIDLEENKFFNSEVRLSPDKNRVILFPEVEGTGNNNIYICDLKNTSISKITENQLTAAASWSTKGDNIFLYQITETQDKFDLWYANKEGVEKKNLQIKAAYPLIITSSDDKYIYATSDYKDNQVIYQINAGSLEKKIIVDSTQEKDLNNITEIGLLPNGLYVVSNDNLFFIKL